MPGEGDWVQINKIILYPWERAPQIPDDTKKVPLELWVKGYLLCDAQIGEIVEIRTVTGRRAAGKLVSVNPPYTHSYGKVAPELLRVRHQVRAILFGGNE